MAGAYKLGRNEYSKQWRQKKKEELGDYYTEYNARFRSKNPLRYIFQSAKARAKQKGIPFDITLDDLSLPVVCPVLGIPLVTHAGKGKQPDSPSIDRIDNSKGYVPGNVWIISWRANDLKKDGTLLEFVKLVEALRAQRPRLP